MRYWFALVAGLIWSVAAYALIGLGVGASGTSLLALLATSTDERRRAAAATITWLMMIAGIALTAGGVGALLDPYSPARLLAIVAGVVALTMAARRIPVQIPRKVVGRGRVREGQKSFIPLRVNSAGVMPIIFAQSIIIVPGTLYAFTGNQGVATSGVAGVLYDLSQIFQVGEPWYFITYSILIIFFTYFYTSIIFNPLDLAENLKKQGGFIPGVKPGSATAEYIDDVLTKVTLPGSVYLAVIAVLPFGIFEAFDIQAFFFGGTSLLIVVGVALDTVQKMQQHLLLRQYEGFMKQGRAGAGGRQRYM